ncbi:2-aminoethanethiol dioxygenase-like [Halichoeres trimaculatus]|uniref:2-aminoethanethiol dioxygenase-like n=1 Tax=Halichoeres trimaculatus TaxID=147232 RepID=UPI003D9F9047
MPRDNKIPLIQRVAQQAHLTFKDFKRETNGDNNLDPDSHSELVSLVTAIRAADLKIQPRKPKASPGAAGPQNPPVTYMHICETEVLSMGVFLLKAGASIPLHDHPGMNGMLKVLYGKVSVRCFDRLEDHLSVSLPEFDPPLTPPETASVWRSVLRSVAEFSDSSGPCLLTPLRENLHQIHAVDGPAAFLDILAPPYNPEDGRDCHYYRVLHPVGEGGGRQREKGEEKEEEREESWLLEVPQPDDFWCGGEAYLGPAVSV